MPRKAYKLISLLLVILFIFQQSGFAQVAAQLNIASHLSALRSSFVSDKFRPLHLRYLSYNSQENTFRLLLDKGDVISPQSTVDSPQVKQVIEETSKKLLKYFLIGVTLPNDTFWVNLRPDSPDNIIDPSLEQTDIGRIMLETDLQLKKDTASATSPQTPEGREYWDKLYKKAEELFGSENITIPTLTRPWIVPDEIIVRETTDSAYVYKATLKVMLEQDYLKDSANYSFNDPRLKVLNEYSSQLIRELIIPKLTKEVNSSKRYASLRQVYYSLIMAQWFKARFAGKDGQYAGLINTKNLANLTCQEPYSKDMYFKEYQNSFKDGEYNIKEPAYTPFGQVIRSYFSGGEALQVCTGVAWQGERNSADVLGRSKHVVKVRLSGDKEKFDVSFERSISGIDSEAFTAAWQQGTILAIPLSMGTMLHDPAMGPQFRAPEVRLVSQAVMDMVAPGHNVVRLPGSNKVLIINSYWESQSVQERLDILMHEGMADWMQQNKKLAQDAAIDLEHGIPQDNTEALQKRQERRNAHTAEVDLSMEGADEVTVVSKACARPVTDAEELSVKNGEYRRITTELMKWKYLLQFVIYLAEREPIDLQDWYDNKEIEFAHDGEQMAIPSGYPVEVFKLLDLIHDGTIDLNAVLEDLSRYCAHVYKDQDLYTWCQGIFGKERKRVFRNTGLLQRNVLPSKREIFEVYRKAAGDCLQDALGRFAHSQLSLGYRQALSHALALEVLPPAIFRPNPLEDINAQIKTCQDKVGLGKFTSALINVLISWQKSEEYQVSYNSDSARSIVDLVVRLQKVLDYCKSISADYFDPRRLDRDTNIRVFFKERGRVPIVGTSEDSGVTFSFLEGHSIPTDSPINIAISEIEGIQILRKAEERDFPGILSRLNYDFDRLQRKFTKYETSSPVSNITPVILRYVALSRDFVRQRELLEAVACLMITLRLFESIKQNVDSEDLLLIDTDNIDYLIGQVCELVASLQYEHDHWQVSDSRLEFLKNGYILAQLNDWGHRLSSPLAAINTLKYYSYTKNKRLSEIRKNEVENLIKEWIITEDSSFEGGIVQVNAAAFTAAWQQGASVIIPSSMAAVLNDRKMGLQFRAPEVRLVSQSIMNMAAPGHNVARLPGSNKVLITDVYWDSQLEQERLDILMHEGMADWMQQNKKLAQDAAIDLEHGIPQDNTEALQKRQERRNAHTAEVDLSMEGERVLSQPNEVGAKPSNGTASGTPSITAKGAPGGIDFRSLPIVTQAIRNLSLGINPQEMRKFNSFNLPQEWSQIQRMSEAGIVPSTERIKEYVQAACIQGNAVQERDDIILYIADLLRAEEENYSSTDPLMRDILIVLDLNSSGQELKVIFTGIKS